MTLFSPIAARVSLSLDEEYLRMQNEWFFKWHHIGRERPVEIDSFDGRNLVYGGVAFAGSPHDMYWQTIQRYLRKKIGAIFDEVEAELPKYSIEVRETALQEIRYTVRRFAAKIREAAVEKDRVLRGNGVSFPPACDFGQWLGCSSADIDVRVASLCEIYCDRKITIEGVEMTMKNLKAMMNEKLALVKRDGSLYRENIPGRVTDNLVMTFVSDLPIEAGDHILRKLPSGLVDDFVVVDPGYQAEAGPISPHFQTKVRRSERPTSLQQAVVQSITNNFHGNNVRVNTNSVDNSINIVGDIVVSDLSAFLDQARPEISKLPIHAQRKMEGHLAILDDEVRSAEPSQPRMRAALQSLKAIAEGTTGNLISAGIGSMVGALLSGG